MASVLRRVCLSPRYARFFALVLVLLLCLIFLVPHETRTFLPPSYPSFPTPQETPPFSFSATDDILPPLYERYTAFQDSFPQHDESLPFPEGSSVKFIYFANQAWGAGWGNIMQQIVMNAQLAYASGRTFVFDSYTWKRDGKYAEFNGKLIPSQIPLSALLAGPLIGYPYLDSTITTTHPRAVSWHYYNRVCPDPYILDPTDIMRALTLSATALQTMNVWIDKIQSIEDRCIEIKKDSAQLFDIWLFGTPRLHNIMPTIMNSPIVKDFSWSPLIHYAFQKNLHHFNSSDLVPRTSPKNILFSYFSRNRDYYGDGREFALSPTPPASKTDSLPLLAIHLRRGDFIQHCDTLLTWNSTYHGYNTLPSLPDRFFAENSTLLDILPKEEIQRQYREKCFVDVDSARKRVVKVVREWRAERLKIEAEKNKNEPLGTLEAKVKKMLRKVYIMTNGDPEFLQELKIALHSDTHRSSSSSFNLNSNSLSEYDYDFIWDWDDISTSRDLDLGWETKYVAQAMDMYVGQRAEVFIGNGFSSLTANVVLMRVVAGVEPWRTRFW
ncbi:hypothetical protein Agabi119p4_10320 [Agaricus bisporus var. burnettii]|uniref:Uncharacterized protein n=1 Tax=Agaricus bisporus var. burnettii TaxID=192524 RepID=A0A8H7C2R3_AGABI|nr:hypothetical protein Agabi119p4_10320 [Agaricus bisporus var. burnettii]